MYNGLFKTVTPVSAYWLGWMASDGWVARYAESVHHLVGLNLHSRDKYIVEKFCTDIGYEISRIKHYIEKCDCVRFRVCNKDIFDDLNYLGIHPNKSLTIDGSCIPDKYTSHFIRGLFDGDGCITMTPKHNMAGWNCRFVIYGNKPLLQSILLKTPILGNIYQRKSICALDTGKKLNIIDNFHYIYQDSQDYKLTRKYDKFIQVIDFCMSKHNQHYTLYKTNKHGIKVAYMTRQCPKCNIVFECPAYSKQICCSQSCAKTQPPEQRKYSKIINGQYYYQKKCNICHKKYDGKKRQKYCSIRCYRNSYSRSKKNNI